MSSSDVATILGAVSWSDEGSYIKEIIGKTSLPQLAKVIKGQYLSVGVASLANPGLSSTLLLLSAGKNVRVAAQSVKFKEGRRVVPVGPRLAIPDSYDGYFEILSEDGRAVKCIESVAELAKRFPDSCLVRETIKAYVSRSDDIESITDKTRPVQAGETLVLVGDVLGPKNGKSQLKFLRCFDQAGQNIYLPYDAKGKFSAIAKEDNISGVHSIKNLLNKRLPLMVRLINGRPPLGTKSSSNFLPELRLYGAFTEEAIAALPLAKDTPMTILPPSVPLKLNSAKNTEQLEKTKEFLRICEKANNLLSEIRDRILVYDVAVRGGKSGFGGSRDPRFSNADAVKSRKYLHVSSGRGPLRSKNVSLTPVQLKSFHDRKSEDVRTTGNSPKDDYDEIDQIYDYVRGFAPLPKNIRSPFANKDDSPLRRSIAEPPRPPPLETLPTRRMVEPRPQEKLSPSIHPALISAALEKAERRVEKRTRRSDEKNSQLINSSSNSIPQTSPVLPGQIGRIHGKTNSKLFVKASHQKSSSIKPHIFRQKSSSPSKDQAVISAEGISPVISTSPSSIFRLRYKSLTNLAMDLDTLDSSTSCGKTSADSSGSAALKARVPEKKCRRLARPKSLTNLVWDTRGCNTGLTNTPDLVGGTAKAIVELERRMRLEPGVYRHGRDAPALLAATTRLLASHKKIGTLYL